MAKKKSKKKPLRKSPVRRVPWSDVFSPSIIDRVLAPDLIALVRDNEVFAKAPSLARLHALFELEHNCSIPRDLFDKVAADAGISFSRSISLGRNVRPPSNADQGSNLPVQRQTLDNSFGDRVRRTSIPTSIPTFIPPDGNGQEAIVGDQGDEGPDGFRITNDNVSPEVAANDEARRQAQVEAAIAEANGEVPEPIIIPR